VKLTTRNSLLSSCSSEFIKCEFDRRNIPPVRLRKIGPQAFSPTIPADFLFSSAALIEPQSSFSFEIALRLFSLYNTPLPCCLQTEAARHRFCQSGTGRKNHTHERKISQCRFIAITPTCAARGAGIIGCRSAGTRSRRKAFGKVFRAGLGIPPSGETDRSPGIWSAYRLEQTEHSAGICGRGIPAGAVRSGRARRPWRAYAEDYSTR